MIGAKKFTWNTCCQASHVGLDRAEPRAALGLRRDRGIVDQRVQLAAFEPLLDLLRWPASVFSGSARSTWMWSSGPASHGHFSGNGCREQVMTRQPAAGKALHRRVADAAACAGQQQCAARRVGVDRRCHLGSRICLVEAHGYSRVLVHGASGAVRRNSMRSCSRNGRSCQNSIAIGAIAIAASSTAVAAHAPIDVFCGLLRHRLLERETAFQRLPIACSPRRRSAPAAAGWRNRHRPPHR